MCGHVGVAGDLNVAATRAFKDMLYMDALRGEHGTGIATIPFRGERTVERSNIVKAPFSASICLKNGAFEKAAENPTSGVIIGHNRHATVGEHIQGNTHPFLRGDIIGAHNGTVSIANRDLDVDGSFGTDSEKIMASINKHGIQDTVKNMTSCSQGAWALVWYDFKTNEINLLRNDYRPLYYGFSKDRKQMYWASESYMLQAATSRRDASLDKVYSLPVDTHLRWTVPKPGEVFQDKPTRRKCAGKKPKTATKSTTRTNTTYRSYGSTTAYSKVNLPADFDTKLKSFPDFNNKDVNTLFSSNKQCIYCHCDVSQKEVEDGDAVVVAKDSVVCSEHAKLPLFADSIKARIRTEKKAVKA